VYDPKYEALNLLATLGFVVMAVGGIPFVINFLWSMVAGKPAGDNPWRALTLEWQTSSPPPPENFTTDPVPYIDPYGYGTPESAAYIASGGRLLVTAVGHGTDHAVSAEVHDLNQGLVNDEKPTGGDR